MSFKKQYFGGSEPNPLSDVDVKRMKTLKDELESGRGRDGIVKVEEKKSELVGLETRFRISGVDVKVELNERRR